MTVDFVQQMHRFIAQHKMIEDGETVLVAVSGGADSLALLYGLHALRSQLNCQLHVAHLNHCLRPDADADADFVRQHAKHLKLPCTIQRMEIPRLAQQWKLSVEAAGRRARYQFYESIATKVDATKVALGHHQDDVAETVLMNLIRGSGATGLKGITPVRDAKFIRPLAGFTRQQIEAFLTSIGVAPKHDTTNTDTRYLRNRIRHELIPQLENNYNPNIKTGLSRTADVLRAESEYLATAAREALETCRIQDLHERVVLDRVAFRQYHIALQRRMLRQSVSEMSGDMSDLYFAHCEKMLNLIQAEASNALLALPNGLQFRRAYQQLIFERKPVETGNFAYPIVTVGKTSIEVLNTQITAELRNTKFPSTLALPDGRFEAIFDYEKIRKVFAEPSLEAFPLTVRNRRQGDRFQPYGMRGTKKIKDFLIDAKVPRYERDSIPLLVCGNQILWIIGYTTSDTFKIESDTRQYLYLRYASNETSS
ncbi:tRNA lysidine(34) synthetase TilS [Candidatus Poribacteria bacterium]|nr:tRNA lysidine(34) synthetase TilS [Candidatus Poribacteria bacterium]